MTTESVLRDALAAHFEEYTIRGCLRSRERNTVYEVSVDGRRAVCKMTTAQPAMLACEGAVIEAVGTRTEVPVPSVLAAGEGYLVLAWALGDTYEHTAPQDQRRARLRAVGRLLARLHSTTAGWFDGHGMFKYGDDGLVVDQAIDWPSRLDAFLTDWVADLSDSQHADLGRAVQDVFERYAHAFRDCQPVLIHGEPSPDHVQFDGIDVAAVLDWEIAQAAPGEFDLVWAERDFGRMLLAPDDDTGVRTALHDGYETERGCGRSRKAAFRCEFYRAAFAMRDLHLVEDTTKGIELDGKSLRRYVSNRLGDAESIAEPGEW
jgi:aminoglycoside phosphotransferase (APT) family kinase protein